MDDPIHLLPQFNLDGLLPAGDYELSFEQLAQSMLVRGPVDRSACPNWDESWRKTLVERLEILVRQLWKVGITEIFINGSFVEDKEHPNDIDGYFLCDLRRFATGELERDLNLLDPHKVWTWAPSSRRPYRGYPKRQLPMWHVYRVELYPHWVGNLCGIRDKYGHELEFPAAFRQCRRSFKPKGIVKIIGEP